MKDVPVRSTSQSWPGATMALPSGCPGNVAYEICEFYHHVQAASEAINLAGVLLQGERPKEAIQILNDVVDDMSESGWLASLSNPLAYLAIPTSIVRMDYQLPSIFSCSVENITPDHDTNKDFSSSSSPSNYFSFYARSFCFTDERPRTHHAWLRRMRLLPAVLFYNLGLAHHILALDSVEQHGLCVLALFRRPQGTAVCRTLVDDLCQYRLCAVAAQGRIRLLLHELIVCVEPIPSLCAGGVDDARDSLYNR
jgi:hypothetical protein